MMMHFVLQTPSLQHLAGVKIITHLWTQRDIFTLIARSFNQFHFHGLAQEMNEWKAIEEKVEKKVGALTLPQLCKNQLVNLVKPLGMELIVWSNYNNNCDDNITFQFLDDLLPQQMCWTMHGTVGYAKSAELMVKDERLSLERRYEIACINCLEDEIRQLFRSMAEEQREEYVKKMRNMSCSRQHPHHLIVFFTCSITYDVEGFRNLCYERERSTFLGDVIIKSFNKKLFKNMLAKGTRATFEYLFKKLNQKEQEQEFFKCRMETLSQRHLSSSCSALYYLSLMNEEQQERLFRKGSGDLLQCLLRWPMQSLFMEAAECGWQSMYNIDCFNVLIAITRKVRFGFRDFDYWQLFCECWRLTRADYKQHFLMNDRFLEDLLLTKREEFIKFVLIEGPLNFLKDLHVGVYGFCNVLMNESAISDAALMECKETAALTNSNDEEDEEKRLRSEYVSRLVDIVMEEKVKRRL